jgi:hypothetical protein
VSAIRLGTVGPPSRKETFVRSLAREVKESDAGSAGRWVDLVFGPRREAPNDSVLVFHHVRKTAGTSLKDTILRNAPSGKLVRLLYPDGATSDVRRWWADLFAKMTPDERGTLWAVSSHTAGFALEHLSPRYVAITLVRDPVDQALSRWFMRKSARAGGEQADLEKLRQLYLAGKENVTWYNPQARTLLEPHFDVEELSYTLGPPPDADVWRRRLFALLGREFLVGVQERYADSVRMFGEHVGWRDYELAAHKVN